MFREKRILFVFFLFGICTSGKISGQVVAGFSYTNPCVSSPVQFQDTSSTSNLSIDSVYWDFGDPGSGALNFSVNDFNPEHIYSATGSFTVTLTAMDDLGNTDTFILTITILPSPVSNFSFTSVCFGVPTAFTDLSGVVSPETITGRLWSFGDLNTDTSLNPSHLYGAANDYSVSLMVTSSNGCYNTFIDTVKVHAIPIVKVGSDFIACLNSTELFLDQSSVFHGTVVQRLWTFGALGSDTAGIADIVFPSSGTFSFTLSVTSDGNCTSSDSFSVSVFEPPVAGFSFTPQVGYPPLVVNFNNQTSVATGYLWDFGDGNSSTEISPTHVYSDTGAFHICLTAFDSYGCAGVPQCSDLLVRRPITDLAVLNLIYTEQTGVLKLAARLANYGNFDITSVDLVAELGGNFEVIEHFTDTLKAGKEFLYYFSSSFQINTNDDELFVCVQANLIGQTDEDASNDKQCSSIGGDFFVSDPFPNPVKDLLKFEFILPESGTLSMTMYDLLGKKAAAYTNENAQPGLNTFQMDVSGIRNGIYSCKSVYEGKSVMRLVVKY